MIFFSSAWELLTGMWNTNCWRMVFFSNIWDLLPALISVQ